MARFGNLPALLLFAAGTLYACGGETFRARDEALAGQAGEAGASTGGASGRSGDDGRGGGSGSANGGIGAQPTAGSGNGSGGGEPPAAAGEGGLGSSGSSGGVRQNQGGASAGGPGAAGIGMGGAGTAGSAGSGTAATGGSGGAGELVGGCGQQLLHNANFDAGPTPEWSQSSSWSGELDIIVAGGTPALMAEGVAPDSGNYLAWLGGIPDNEFDHYRVDLRQTVSVPATAALLTLTGKTLVKTEEDNSYAADLAYLEFALDDDLVWQAKALTNLDSENGTGWIAFTASTADLDDIRGQTLTFVAYSRTDPTLKTSFWIDSLRLEATCER